jgi:folate-binding protein YgfZ
MRELYLKDIHAAAGAHFTEIQGCRIPADYGDVGGELRAINNTVALLDRSYLGKLVLRGRDGLDLLNRISTNDVLHLTAGSVLDTVFATPKGRMIDLCRVISNGDDLLMISSFFRSEHLVEWINRFIILEDADVKDVSTEYLWVTMLGPRAQHVIASLARESVSENDEAIWLDVAGETFPALRNSNFRVPAYNFCFSTANAARIFARLEEIVREFDGMLVGDTAFQVVRVESGMPDWGTEISQEYNPHEARLNHAISYTKGCYTGQEVIARLDTYDKVQKYLMIIELDRKMVHQPPLEVFIDDESVGHLTSYVFDPVSNRSVGLGYIQKMYTIQSDIYIEVQAEAGRIPGKLKLPPQAYRDR